MEIFVGLEGCDVNGGGCTSSIRESSLCVVGSDGISGRYCKRSMGARLSSVV